MKKLFSLVMLATVSVTPSVIFSQEISEASTQVVSGISNDLSDIDRQLLIQRIERILEKDQQFRTYLSFGTTDEKKIADIHKLDMQGHLKAMSEKKNELSADVEDVFRQLQRKNDTENYAEFVEIVKQYGYPSAERLGVETDKLFVLLLHPPVDLEEIEDHTRDFCDLLLPEVKSGRMKPKLYATFVDNMRGKILRRPQLYGTNQVFDRATGNILPPQIEDIEISNQARREIGLPELEEGDYRLVANKT